MKPLHKGLGSAIARGTLTLLLGVMVSAAIQTDAAPAVPNDPAVARKASGAWLAIVDAGQHGTSWDSAGYFVRPL
ncbi:MAG TPA: hypothetical protein VJ596_09605 [Gemmatimonadaceae bacterium]|nr:hypothetical protein [Gemmatimonadaceae bacterium]